MCVFNAILLKTLNFGGNLGYLPWDNFLFLEHVGWLLGSYKDPKQVGLVECGGCQGGAKGPP